LVLSLALSAFNSGGKLVSIPIDQRTFVRPFGPSYFGCERVADPEG
jgi:hypothetical protein